MLKIAHRINKIRELKQVPTEYGVEIDVRSYGRNLILNHEPHKTGDNLENYLANCEERFIIFNVKEAGIEEEVIHLAEKYGVRDYFLLDVEFPFIYKVTRGQENPFRKIAVRFSEAEPLEFTLAQTLKGKSLVDWVWVDTNTCLPLNKNNYSQFKKAGFKLCLVCPERWKRPESIQDYINYMKENKIKIDAVMTSLSCLDKWKAMD